MVLHALLDVQRETVQVLVCAPIGCCCCNAFVTASFPKKKKKKKTKVLFVS